MQVNLGHCHKINYCEYFFSGLEPELRWSKDRGVLDLQLLWISGCQCSYSRKVEIRPNPLSLQFTSGTGHFSTGHACAEHLQFMELRHSRRKENNYIRHQEWVHEDLIHTLNHALLCFLNLDLQIKSPDLQTPLGVTVFSMHNLDFPSKQAVPRNPGSTT